MFEVREVSSAARVIDIVGDLTGSSEAELMHAWERASVEASARWC